MSFRFNYDEFFKYYTKSNKILIDHDTPRPTVWFFTPDKTLIRELKKKKKNKKTNQTDESIPMIINHSSLSDKYVLINDVKVYIRILGDNNDELIFTIPTEMHGRLFDFHYHIGIKNLRGKIPPKIEDKIFLRKKSTLSININNTRHRIPNNIRKRSTQKTREKINSKPSLQYELTNEIDKKIPNILPKYTDNLIFFHKTDQIVTSITPESNWSGQNTHTICSFENNRQMDKSKIGKIICLDTDKYLMGNRFNDLEFQQIIEILSKPFIEEEEAIAKSSFGGTYKKLRKHKNTTRKCIKNKAILARR